METVLADLLPGGDLLLIVPPFAQIEVAALPVHTLQAWCRRAGFKVSIFYANILFAEMMGLEAYNAYCRGNTFNLALPGERVFARAAFDLPSLGYNAERMYDCEQMIGPDKARDIGDAHFKYPPFARVGPEELRAMEAFVDPWIARARDIILAAPYRVVGCSSSYEQTNASFALLRAIRRAQPDRCTILGGPNCAGQMAVGMVSLDPEGSCVDHVFSGESENTLVEFLRGGRRFDRIIQGGPFHDLESAPIPDFTDYYAQLDRVFPGLVEAAPTSYQVAFETSRGCSRGVKGTCHFCGSATDDRSFRRKSAGKARTELRELGRLHPGRTICMSDNIMPEDYVRAFAEDPPGPTLFYTIHPVVSPQKAVRLKKGGATLVIPGIEAFDTRLLAVMNKGTRASQAILTLRHLRAAEVYPFWYLIWGLPGDDVSSYERELALLPLLTHLVPPGAVYHLSIERFSPYWRDPARFGIENLRPIVAHAQVTPPSADLVNLAYHFVGSYRSGAYERLDLIRSIQEQVGRWRAAWEEGRAPRLVATRLGMEFLFVDTREITGSGTIHRVSPERATEALTPAVWTGSDHQVWAVEQRIALHLDDGFVPLAIAPPSVLESLGSQEAPIED